jgi:dephospho-CoA kinase
MLIIGLTGPSGAGKGTASAAWRELGAFVLDCDAMYHGMLRGDDALRGDLCAAFPEAADGDGGVDRRKLAGIVFSDKARLEQLNTLAFTHINRKIGEIIAEQRANGTSCIILDAPTLFEAGADSLCDVIVAVTAPEEVRAARIAARDGIPMEAVQARFRNQHSDAFFREKCDYVLENQGSVDKLHTDAVELWKKLVG